MFHKSVEKNWHGHVSVRTYEIAKAKYSGGLVIRHNNEKMTLTPDRLENLKPSTMVTAKYPEKKYNIKVGDKYGLVDIRWNPDDENETQMRLFS